MVRAFNWDQRGQLTRILIKRNRSMYTLCDAELKPVGTWDTL